MRRGLLGVVALLMVGVLGGCKGLEDYTLPGGKAGFGSAQVFTIDFDDVLDLVPQSGVHFNDVTVGQVKSIDLVNGRAHVTIRVLKSTVIPDNVVATIRQTALLGEKYVSLEVPPGAVPGPPITAHQITRTSQDEVQVEDIFGALSALLNGGGVEQLQTISVELTQALSGRESNLRSLLGDLNALTGSLDVHRTEIVHALQSLDALASQLVAQRQTIATALRDIAPGLKVLADERTDLVKLLTGLDTLGTTAKRVLGKTTADTAADLHLLQPTLDRLSQVGDEIGSSLQLLLSYPFGDASIKAIPGDYTGLRVTLNLDLRASSPTNPLSPNGPLCGSLPINLGITLPKPSFCANAQAAAKLAESAPKQTVNPVPTGGTAKDVVSGVFK